MATPFSPFVGRPPKPIPKRRQSQLPSDLIDWDAPEIPELEKQRIIYEDHIKDIEEDHAIEDLLNEQIFTTAHDAILAEYQSKMKNLENDVTKEHSKVNLLLGQIKMFENNVKDTNERVDELENELTNQRNSNLKLEQERENWIEERDTLQMEIEELKIKLEVLKDNTARVEELENEVTLQRNCNIGLEQEKESWIEERNTLQTEIEELKFTNNEISSVTNQTVELLMQEKKKAAVLKRKVDRIMECVAFYKMKMIETDNMAE